MPGKHSSSNEWSVTCTRQIAANVRHHRERQNLSVQTVANRCAEMGVPITRPKLAKLESGHGNLLTVPELLVLAHALDTPPLLLLAPVGRTDSAVEIVPGVETDPHTAAAWIDGSAPLPTDPQDAGAAARAELRLLREHQRLLDQWTSRTRAAAASHERAGDGPHAKAWSEAAHLHTREAEHAAERIADQRDNMRARGITPPPLPPGLLHLDHRP
ncbi:helix-turn-helix domain-containing protein [Nonomuraea sp. NPDC051941]|uniref:helix-turn-helix domain-containing protein n=1 Tax=Nonomuraea sp. NPDC051941 TaxID=3364373 RepID=UPI0037C9FDDE